MSFPDLPLVWLSHFGASCGPSPLNITPGKEYWADYAKTRKAYSWPNFSQYHEIARARVPGPNRWFLDMGALATRVDWRVAMAPGTEFPRDCLHFCAFGPLEDLIPRLLQQALHDLPDNS